MFPVLLSIAGCLLFSSSDIPTTCDDLPGCPEPSDTDTPTDSADPGVDSDDGGSDSGYVGGDTDTGGDAGETGDTGGGDETSGEGDEELEDRIEKLLAAGKLIDLTGRHDRHRAPDEFVNLGPVDFEQLAVGAAFAQHDLLWCLLCQQAGH